MKQRDHADQTRRPTMSFVGAMTDDGARVVQYLIRDADGRCRVERFPDEAEAERYAAARGIQTRALSALSGDL